MPISWSKRNKCYRFHFNRVIEGKRYRASKLLPRGWGQAEADAFSRKEEGRIYAVATGVGQTDPLISEAVMLYLKDKQELKSIKKATENLAAIVWAYDGRRMSELSKVADEVRIKDAHLKPATIKQRLALLKAACRWAWKKHELTKHDPTTTMQMPTVRNERHVYSGRREMLMACRACTNWSAQIAIRVAFYSGLRLGEILRVTAKDGVLFLADTKNGSVRAVPLHHKIAHLARFLPLNAPKITIQRAWSRARDAVGLQGMHFHDWRHSAASEMINAKVDLYTVGQVLGHKDQRSTQRYAHLRADALAGAVGKIGKRAA